MKLVVLDGHTLNPGDLDWSPLEAYGNLTVYDRTGPEETAPRIGGAGIVFTNKVLLDRAVFEACPNLRYVGVTATGYNVVDLAAAREHGVVVTNVPAYSTDAVAQHTFALLLELTNHVGLHSESVKAGAWQACADFCYWQRPLSELAGKTMGIIGFGSIGRAVARIAAAFGMEVVTTSAHVLPADGVRAVTVEELFSRSDVISLHCPLTAENRGFIDRDAIARMKDGVLLINTARGPLINGADLRDALCSGKVGGAAMDVLEQEPPRSGDPLIGAPNCIVTPHLAWASREARTRLLRQTAENLDAFLRGSPIHVVNP